MRAVAALLAALAAASGAAAAPFDPAALAARADQPAGGYFWLPAETEAGRLIEGEREIAAGEMLVVRLPALRALRLSGPDAARLRIATSRQGALWLAVEPERTADALVVRGVDDPLLVALQAPDGEPAVVRVERTEATPAPVFYDALSGDLSLVVRDTGRITEWRAADAPVTVEGPAVVRLGLRVAEPGEPAEALVALDGRVVERVTLPADVDERDILSHAVGRAEDLYLSIPPGRHDLTVDASRPSFLRISTAVAEGAVLSAPLPETMPPAEVEALLGRAADLDFATAWRLARRLAWDLGRDDALAAAALLDTAAGTAPEALAEAEAFRARHTFFRSLEPVDPPPQTVRTQLLVTDGRLPNPRPDPLVVTTSGFRETPAEAVFNAAEGPLRYQLDSVPAPRRLRVSVPAEAAGRVEVTADGRTFTLTADGEPAVPRPSQEQAALVLAAPDRVVAPLVERVRHDIWLPADTRSVTVTAAVPVAVEVETGAQDRLSEDAFLAAAPGDAAGLSDRLARYLDCDGGPWSCASPAAWHDAGNPAEVRDLLLKNDLIPVFDLLKARVETLTEGLDASDGETAAPSPAAMAESERLLAAGDPVAALVALRAVRGWGDAALPARRLQAQALLDAAEPYLAERLLLALAVTRPGTAQGRWAYDRLAEIFRERAAFDLLTGLAANRFAAKGEALEDVVAALLAEGQADAAVRLGLAGGAAGATAEAALAAGWLTAAERLGSPPAAGLAALRRNNLEAAADLLPADWRAALDSGLDLSRALWSEDGDRAGLLSRLSEWWQQHPGPRLDAFAPALVRSHAGALRLRSLRRGLDFSAFRAAPDAPVTLAVAGPADLTLSVRPLHVNPTARDGWIDLEVDGTRKRIPVTANEPSAGLSVVSGAEALPGVEVRVPLALGPGLHRISVGAADVPLAVRPLLRLPASPMPLLPPPTPDALAALAAPPAAPAVTAQEHGRLRAFPPRAWDELARFGTTAPGGDIPLPAGTHTFPDEPAGRMADMVAQAEARGLTTTLLAEAARLAEAQSADREVQRLFDRLRRLGVRWDPILSPTLSAGVRQVGTTPLAAASPNARARLALLDSAAPVVLSAGRALEVTVPGGTTATLSVRTPPGLPRGPVTVAVENGVDRRVEILPGETRTVPLDGDVRMEVVEAPPSHFVTVALAGDAPDELVETRTWQVATPDQPVVFDLDAEPVWVRVDRLRDGVVTSEVRLVADGRLTLGAEGEETLYRVFRYVPTRLAEPPRSGLRPPLTERQEAAPVVASVAPPQLAVPLAAPADRTPGTYSVGTEFFRRRASDPEGTAPGESEMFLGGELFADWRRRAWPDATWWRLGGLVRGAEDQSPVVGLHAGVDHVLADAPVTLDLDVAAWSQASALHLELSGGATWARDLDEDLRLRLSADAFARALSGGDGDEMLDPDVWSQYKADHRWGLDLGAELEYSVRPQSEAFAGLGLRTNEVFTPDHYRLSWGWRELIGDDVVVEVEHRLRLFAADDDRAASAWRNTLSLDVLWEQPTGDAERWDLGLGADYDVEDDAVTAALRLTWHFGAVDRHADFAPGAVDFERLRRARALAEGGGADGR